MSILDMTILECETYLRTARGTSPEENAQYDKVFKLLLSLETLQENATTERLLHSNVKNEGKVPRVGEASVSRPRDTGGRRLRICSTGSQGRARLNPDT